MEITRFAQYRSAFVNGTEDIGIAKSGYWVCKIVNEWDVYKDILGGIVCADDYQTLLSTGGEYTISYL